MDRVFCRLGFIFSKELFVLGVDLFTTSEGAVYLHKLSDWLSKAAHMEEQQIRGGWAKCKHSQHVSGFSGIQG